MIPQLYEEQISTGVIAVAQACCEPGLQSSTEHWRSYSALTSAAVHCCCFTAHLHEEQSSIGAIAATQACCEPGLQSSTQQWGSYVALTIAELLLVLYHCTPA